MLVVLGLLMAPVSCMCGASVPHGHSLFQLPNHNHGAVDDHEDDSGSVSEHSGAYAHLPHPLMLDDPECDNGHLTYPYAGDEGVARSNAMEQQSGAVLQTPPSSSFGQPMVMAQSSAIDTPTPTECEPLNLPATRTLEGLETLPETPPPQA